MSNSPITTHVLDTRLGQPAVSVGVHLERLDAAGHWHMLASAATDDDGRASDLLAPAKITKGTHRISFATGQYFKNQAVATFFPQVAIQFEVDDENAHYHVPLLLSPFGYSTYRGS